MESIENNRIAEIERQRDHLVKDLRFWRLESWMYRYLNLALYLCSRIGIPVISTLVSANIVLTTTTEGFLSKLQMAILGVLVVALSTLDTVLRPGDKMRYAYQRVTELSGMEHRLLLDYLQAEKSEEKANTLKQYATELEDLLNEYKTRGYGD